MIKCILFDRDGTLGELSDVRYPETFHAYADIKKCFASIQKKGYFVGIITNQSSIARGTGTDYDFEKEFLSYGVDVWKICPHDNEDHCNCRKPKSGLLLAAAEELRISPSECLVVGDRLSDILCAKNVGANAALVTTGYNEKENVLAQFPDTPILSRFDKILNLI